MAVSDTITTRDQLYIGGEWIDPAGEDTLEVRNPATEQVIARIPAGTPDDVDRAVTAARAAFETWSQTSVEERANYLEAITAGLQERQDEIATVIATELGMPFP